MGAKTPEQEKKANKPQPTVKCDDCGRTFLNVAAWKSHYKFQHAKTEVIKKKMVPLHLLKRVAPLETTESTKVETTPSKVVVTATAPRKPEFACPVCAAKFPVYFTAFRHIQKNHCVDENGVKVPPNSASLVKPIRIEMCATCKQEIRSTDPHECPKLQLQTYKDQYMCLGCDQVFCGLVLFQHHVKGLHSDGAENFFFPSRNEFESWKTELQKSMDISFIRLNKPKTKEIYHCAHQPNITVTTTKLCPATIIVREYSKGVHVCYFKDHCDHKVNETAPMKNYNKYSISLYTRETEDSKLDAEEDNDLYKQLKTMVTCIIKDAVTADVTTLKSLLDKALEMTTVLKRFHGEDHTSQLANKSLSDDQITKSLDSLKPKTKRKQSFEKKTEEVVPKKVKKPAPVENGVASRLRRSSTAALNKSVSFSKTIITNDEVKTTDKELEELLEEGLGLTPQKSSLKKTEETSKVSKKAEETSKVSKRAEETSKVSKKAEETSKVSKKAEETSKVSKRAEETSKVSKKAEETSKVSKRAEETSKVSKKAEEKSKVSKKAEENLPEETPRSLLQSPSSFNDSYKNFVDQNFPTVNEMSTPKVKPNVRINETSTPKAKPNVRKKEVMKTKIGQFKPSSPKNVSPKSPKLVKEVDKVPVALKPKADIQYVVKEQENDCNILILKI